MRVTRKDRSFEAAAIIALRLLAIDRELMAIAAGTNCLTLQAKGELAATQRKIRRMRIEIEVEGGLPDLGRDFDGGMVR